MLKAYLVERPDPKDTNFVFLKWSSKVEHGVELQLPFIHTLADAARLAQEMSDCIQVLDAFILEGLPTKEEMEARDECGCPNCERETLQAVWGSRIHPTFQSIVDEIQGINRGL